MIEALLSLVSLMILHMQAFRILECYEEVGDGEETPITVPSGSCLEFIQWLLRNRQDPSRKALTLPVLFARCEGGSVLWLPTSPHLFSSNIFRTPEVKTNLISKPGRLHSYLLSF
jgi:hypothetical protein